MDELGVTGESVEVFSGDIMDRNGLLGRVRCVDTGVLGGVHNMELIEDLPENFVVADWEKWRDEFLQGTAALGVHAGPSKLRGGGFVQQ